MLLRELIYRPKRRILKENLSKGSMTVMSKPELVASLAATVRDDADMNPAFFGGIAAAKKLEKMSDEDVARWFLNQLDMMETEGYRGFRYSQDGVNNRWIVQNYVELRDTWEDITGKMQSVLFDFYSLRNRDKENRRLRRPPLLDDKHIDIGKFKGIRELGHYLVTHYAGIVRELRDTILKSAKDKLIDKKAKAIPVVTNDDYTIYMVLNRYAAQKLARGAIWCTGMDNTDYHYKHYTSKAAVFVIFPNDSQQVSVVSGQRRIDGREKYQFDAGGPWFMNIGDIMVDAQSIRQRFPYLYDDLTKGLQANKERLEQIMDALSQDQSLAQDPDTKTLKYDIDLEIQKLDKFITRGFMTREERPAQIAAPEQGAEQGAEPPAA